MKKRAVQYALFFLVAGLAIVVLIGYVQRKTISFYEDSRPYLSISEAVKNHNLKARLGMVQLSSGNGAANYEKDVIASLKSSSSILQSAYDGTSSEVGEFVKLDNEDTRALLKESVIASEKLIAVAEENYKEIKEAQNVPDSLAATAPKPDVKKFDAQYDQLQSLIDRLATQASDMSTTQQSSLEWISWLSLALLTIVVGGFVFIFYTLQGKRDALVEENLVKTQQQEKAVSSLSTFIESISAGNFSSELEMVDSSLSTTLLKMRDKLRDNAESDRKRNWSTTGMAQIGEILRSNSSSTTELYDNILRFLVKYTKSNQGGLFLLDDESETDKHLDLVACYAFERKKYLEKKVVLGEGLIGQCYLEGQRIYLIEVPQEYIRITSGLGGSNPNALLIVPLKVNEKIYGVLELATFGKYEEFEIELVEKLAESIASTISTVRINESTRILLEKTQQQAEEMRAQEEEMRQNMEELEATQEEMRRKEKHIEVMLENERKRNEFNNKGRNLVVELSKSKSLLEGIWDEALEKVTKSICEHLKIGKVSIFEYDDVMNALVVEKSYNFENRSFSNGIVLKGSDHSAFVKLVAAEKIIVANDALNHTDTRDLVSTYLRPNNINSILVLPFLSEGKVAGFISCEDQDLKDWNDDHVEFLKSVADILTVTRNTARINAMVLNLSEAQETLQTIIDNLPRAVFWKDRDLRIQGCNKIFAKVAGLNSHLDMIGKTDFDMPWKEHADAYRADDLHVMNTRIARIDLEEKNTNSDGVESWVLTSKVPVLNKDGEVVAVLGMFEDITARKQKEAEVNQKLKELDRLKNMLENQKN